MRSTVQQDQQKKPMPDESTAPLRSIQNWHCKEMRHEAVLERLCMKKENFHKTNMRICNLHQWERINLQKTITRKNGKTRLLEWEVSVPCAIGVRHAAANSSCDTRGTARERREVAAWNESYNQMEQHYGPSPSKKNSKS